MDWPEATPPANTAAAQDLEAQVNATLEANEAASNTGNGNSGSSFNDTFSNITGGLASVANAFGVSSWIGGLFGDNQTASGMPLPPDDSKGAFDGGMSTTTKILIGVVVLLGVIVGGIFLFKKYGK